MNATPLKQLVILARMANRVVVRPNAPTYSSIRGITLSGDTVGSTLTDEQHRSAG